jgi:hypothetical protein
VARGWESKSIEAQQHDAGAAAPPKPAITREQAERRAQLTTLTLARARAEAELRSATAGPHREMLERAIADLTRRIEAIEVEAAPGTPR